MNNEKGFTLVELMITVAVIGVLAAIALPAYQEHTIKSQVTEGLTLTQEARDNVIEYHSNTGSLPDNNTMARFSGGEGNYVSSVDVESGGKVVVTFSKDAPRKANIKIDGKKVTLTPTPHATTGNLIWSCSSDMEAKYLPSSCH